jgi:hypothetical protein
MSNSHYGFAPSPEDLALLAELDLSPRLENYPLTVVRLAQLIAELQERSSPGAAKKIAKQLREALGPT